MWVTSDLGACRGPQPFSFRWEDKVSASHFLISLLLAKLPMVCVILLPVSYPVHYIANFLWNRASFELVFLLIRGFALSANPPSESPTKGGLYPFREVYTFDGVHCSPV